MSQGAQDAKTTTIDGHTYRCLMLDPLVATDMVADLGHLLGPSLGALGGALLSDPGDGAKKLMDEGGEALGAGLEKAVVEFFSRFDKAKQREFIAQLGEVTYLVTGDKEVKINAVLSMHFRGRVGSLYKWMGWALKVQFEDFFSPFGIAISRVVQRAAPE
jgi:hypothetical protein